MAIQQVGGRGVYVITGSGRDPRKTSNGQSWADLVTQQKYMLIKEAQKEALRQIEQEQLSFQDRQQRQQQLQQDLLKQIDAERQNIADLRVKELTINEKRERDFQSLSARQKTGGGDSGGGGSSSTTLSIPTRQQVIRDYQNSIKSSQNTKSSLMQERERLKAAEQAGTQLQQFASQMLSARELQDLQTYDDAITLVDKKIGEQNDFSAEQQTELDTFNRTPPSQLDAELKSRAKKTVRTSSGSGRSRSSSQASKPVEPLEPFSLAPEIERRQQRMRELEAEMDALEFEKRPTFDTTNRMRQIASEDYGLETSYRPPQQAVQEPVRQPRQEPVRQPREVDGLYPQGSAYTPSRRAEMDVLGVEPPVEEVIDPRIQPQVEPPVEEVIDPRIQPPVEEVDDFQFQPSAVENLTQPSVQLQPMATPIGDALRQDFRERNDLPLEPTPTLPREQENMFVEDMLGTFEPTKVTPKIDYKQAFIGVQNDTTAVKQRRALELIMDAKFEFGATSPKYEKAKKDILFELNKIIDPKEHRKQQKVERIMDKNPNNYMALSKSVRGLSKQNAEMVMSLFPVSDLTGDTRYANAGQVNEIDEYYTNAKNQIKNNNQIDKRQREKSLEFLELYYVAVIDEFNTIGK